MIDKTNTVVRIWDPYEDCYGYTVNKETSAFKKSLEKVQKYLDESIPFKIGGTGCDVKVVYDENHKNYYGDTIPVYQVKRCDMDFIYCERKTLEDVAKFLWIDGILGPCNHIIW